MTLYGECFEFDVKAAAKDHAQLMLDAHGDAGHEGHDMTKIQEIMFDKMKEIRTLTNWEKLQFVIGHNTSGANSHF